MKKMRLFLLIGVLNVCGCVFAENHFYAGVDAGYANQSDVKQVVSTIYAGSTPLSSIMSDVTTSGSGGEYGLFVGVGSHFSNRFDLSIELGVDGFSNKNRQDNSTSSGVKSTIYEQVSHLVGISLLSGYFDAEDKIIFTGLGGFCWV